MPISVGKLERKGNIGRQRMEQTHAQPGFGGIADNAKELAIGAGKLGRADEQREARGAPLIRLACLVRGRIGSPINGERAASSSVHCFEPPGFTAILVSESLSASSVRGPPPRRAEWNEIRDLHPSSPIPSDQAEEPRPSNAAILRLGVTKELLGIA